MKKKVTSFGKSLRGLLDNICHIYYICALKNYMCKNTHNRLKPRSLVFLCSGLVLFNLNIFGLCFFSIGASDVSAKSSTITLSVGTSTMSVDITPNLSTGVFSKSSNNNISVKTDNYTGYTLGIKAGTTGTNATNLVNGTNTLTSISSAISEATFSAASGTSYDKIGGIGASSTCFNT